MDRGSRGAVEFFASSCRLELSINADRKIQDVFNLFAEAQASTTQPGKQAWAPLTFMPKATAAHLMPAANHSHLPVTCSPEIDALIALDAVIALSISGGKDGTAAALATVAHLDRVGHTGPRVLIHADLGVVEWRDSLPCCELLAQKLGMELIVVRPNAGDMMDRWEGRWDANVKRFTELSCVKLILPWSTPSMRFCTSEKKAAPIASALRKRFPTQRVISVTGIRRQESSSRAKMPVSSIDTRLTRKDAIGMIWNPVIDWPVEQVFSSILDAGLQLHEAYTKYQSSRVSCVFCIMSAAKDLVAAASCPDNHDVYRRMVELEVTSTYAFQGGKWLGDVAPHLLSSDLFDRLRKAKVAAQLRQEAEALIPKHLLYVKGWPSAMPTLEEAQLLADIRNRVATLVGLDIQFTTANAVLERYAQLIAEKALKDAKAARTGGGSAARVLSTQDMLDEEEELHG